MNNTSNDERKQYQETAKSEINLRDIIATLIRGKWIILLVTLLVFNIFFIRTFFEEPVYEAETTVFVGDEQQEMPMDWGQEAKNIINEIEVLQSRSLANEVADVLMDMQYLDEHENKVIPILANIDDEGEFVSMASEDAVAGRLQSATDFAQVPDSDIIEVRARSETPEEATVIANTYAEVYNQRNLEGSRAHTSQVREFLESQLRDRERALNEAETSLQQYMEQHGVVGVDDESRHVIDQVAQLEARKEELQVDIASAEQSLSAMEEQLAEQEPEVAEAITSADDPYISQVQEQIAELEAQRDLVISQNPEAVGQQQYDSRLQEIDNQLENLRSTLETRSSEFVASLSPGDEGYLRDLKQRIAEQQIELQGLRIEENAAGRLLEEYERQFEQLPEMNMEYARLERARQSNEQLYLMIEERYNEAIIAEQSEHGSVDIIDDAQVPASPVSPNMQMNMAIGLFLGLMFGVGFVFVKEALTTKIRTPEDIKKHNLVNLSTIAAMHQEVRKISSKGWITTKGKVISGYVITIANPLSPVSEAFRALRTNLQYAQIDDPVKTIVVTSPNPGEGKSTVAANLAVTYAQNEKKVLIIDGDLRKPMLHTILDLNRKPGITNILFEKESISRGIQPTVIDNLYGLTSGDNLANPADLLGSQKLKALLKSLEREFDVIIFDTPPMLAATDASVLSTACDGVIIVTSARTTKVEDLNLAVESIENVQGKVFGTVLNKFDHRDSYGSKDTQKYYRYGSYGNPTNGARKRTFSS